MSSTITLDDPTVATLGRRAAASNRSIDEEAADLIARALSEDADEAWERSNRRRLELIHKSTTDSLTESDREELERLQTLADRRLEQLDKKRLDEVGRMEAEANRLLTPKV